MPENSQKWTFLNGLLDDKNMIAYHQAKPLVFLRTAIYKAHNS